MLVATLTMHVLVKDLTPEQYKSFCLTMNTIMCEIEEKHEHRDTVAIKMYAE